MSRDLPTGLSDAIDEPVVRPFQAVRIELPDPVYVWTGSGMLTFDDADGNSRDWLGAGGVGSIETLGESTDGSAAGIKVSLLSIPSEFRDDIADQAVPGGILDVGLGALNETFQTIEGFAWLNRYRVDNYKITDGGSTLTVEISGENRAIDQRRPAIKRFTDEYQQRIHPGDRFFEFVPQMTEVQIFWAQSEGTAATSAPIGGSPGGSGLSREGRAADVL